MRTVLIWIVALVLGAAAPALLFCLAWGDFAVFLPAFLITLSHAAVFGLPALFIYRYFGMTRARWALMGGFLIGAVPATIYLWPFAGWLDFVYLAGGLGCLGALGAFTCWVIFRQTGLLK